jgi:hypothetical protein
MTDLTAELTDTEKQWADNLEAVAIENAERMALLMDSERPRFVRTVMKRNRVVYAIWYVGDYRHVYCIKGSNTPEGTIVQCTAFLVKSVDDAFGMQQDWGDGDLTLIVH